MANSLHVGRMLSEYIATKKISKMAMARALEMDPSNLEVRLKKSFMRTDILLEICDILDHNFFADIAATLPPEFSVSANQDHSKDETIAALELEIKMLQREREMLGGIIRGKMQ